MNVPVLLKSIGFPLIIALLTALALFLVRGFAFRFVRLWAAKTNSKADQIIGDSLKTPSIYWCLAIGLQVAVSMSELPDRYGLFLAKVIDVIVILSIAIAVSNVTGRLLENYIERMNLPIPPSNLLFGIVKGTILLIGLLIALTSLGVSITPLVTTLGIGGLAVALALQDTLANLFSGMHILVEKSIRIGDYVRLEGGEEGYVEDITWRATRIRMLRNNMVIVPNSKLAKSTVTNYCLPEKRMALLLRVSVSFASDPDRVEALLVDEARKAVGSVPGLLAEPEPVARLIPGFGEGSLEFTLTCQVKEFTDQFPVQHEMRKRILRRFKEEGISLPLPPRVSYPQNELRLKEEGE
jgi:small-conductance mechanosensitive channel